MTKRILAALLALTLSSPAPAQGVDPVARGLAAAGYARATSTLSRAPTAYDVAGYTVGQSLLDTQHNVYWTLASLTNGSALWIPGVRKTKVIASNRNYLMHAVANVRYLQSRLAYRTGNAPVCNIQLRYLGWYVPSAGGATENVETVNATPLTVTAALEYPSGTITQAYVAGIAPFTVSNVLGQFTQTDPLPVCIPGNTTFWVRTFEDGGSGGFGMYGVIASSQAGDGYESGASLTNKVLSGTIGTTGYYQTYGPSLVVGDSTVYQPAGVLVGDSRLFGGNNSTGDDNAAVTGGDAYGNFGDIARALQIAHIPFINLGTSTSTATQWLVPANVAGRFALVRDVGTFAIDELGINDVNTSVSASAVEANIGAINTLLNSFEFKVIEDTLMPSTNTTDSCATLMNQTLTASNTPRIAVNTAIRANQIVGAYGYIDSTTANEVNSVGAPTLNGGYWKPGYGDAACLHLTPTGAAAQSAADNVSIVQ